MLSMERAVLFLIVSAFLASRIRPAASLSTRMPKIKPPPSSSSSEGSTSKDVRVELFFKTEDELRRRVQFLSSYGVNSFNLVNKSNRDALSRWVDAIRDELPGADVCCHYSAKHHRSRKLDGAFELFDDFLTEMDGKDAGEGRNEVLLITGSGEKRKFNSLSGLQGLAQKSMLSKTSNTPIAVAYNPFFPEEDDRDRERERLEQKVSTGRASKVYLQFGTDLNRLSESLEWLSALRAPDGRPLDVCGSVFLPTKKLIAQQKFWPWNGVFLSEEFLSGEDGARGVVVEMMRLYRRHGCEILVEAPGVRNEKDLEVMESLLKERDARSEDGGTDGKAGTKTRPEGNVATAEQKTKKQKTTKSSLSPSPRASPSALQKPAVLLFGSHDLRVHDNEAFQLASFHSTVVPAFLWSKEQGKWGVRGAVQVVLKDALQNLEGMLGRSGVQLVCRSVDGDPSEELARLCAECGAQTVYWNKEHTTESRIRERRYEEALGNMGVQAVECQSSLLYDPTALSLSKGFNGGHWGTLMPFLKACRAQLGAPRRSIPRHETFALLGSMGDGSSGSTEFTTWPRSTPINDLGISVIKGKDRWDEPILERFTMSEDEALATMDDFFKGGFQRYEKERSRADVDSSTSKLSVHLRLGTLSPNEFFYRMEDSGLDYDERKTISRRLFWRDLAYFQLLNFPDMREASIRGHYDDTEWVRGEEEKRRFEAWRTGRTGFPLVDAGMRELYETGWMTQSVRMVCASFLTEYLRVNWVRGCEWFHYTLADADSAINAMMWQNAGRSGIDQWNFVMSPVAASQDSTGAYTKRWVPELAGLSRPLLHRPWEAPPEILEAAGVVLGKTYPHRVVPDLAKERSLTVDNVLRMRRNNQQCNDGRGYDLIKLPGGQQTVVFTKKEFRIDNKGNVIKVDADRQRRSKGKLSRSGRGRRGRQKAAR